ncbi:(S)-mandelate dehydrogenase (plasmid) [Piscirickettsia salmonis]|uniref:alpha-hydroxy acid oxidase n=1 Tax=Piscirickettsia salmonis TaxID=1238 RepID=UPI0012BA66E8|nr:(S)-mandelate dehydrogenase [Piscirickettsia salmonis]QGP61621.1 (S)-mandelate dehydrogenase [Piscirickettsia salmonis]QGP66483.1 (S)-mandelate dehydrogenase [Piscirickettsia salmonis]
MNFIYNPRYPSVNDLKKRAKKRIPKFAYDYLVGGCNDEISLARNYQDISAVQLRSELMKPFSQSDMTVNLFGHQYSAPFGIAPVGLQGLMWPKAPEILAKAALELNIPYVLSTVSSSSLESISCISEGRAWYQLYNPTEASIRKDLLSRLKAAQYSVLVVTVDVPTFGYRHRDIRNGWHCCEKL